MKEFIFQSFKHLDKSKATMLKQTSLAIHNLCNSLSDDDIQSCNKLLWLKGVT